MKSLLAPLLPCEPQICLHLYRLVYFEHSQQMDSTMCGLLPTYHLISKFIPTVVAVVNVATPILFFY